MVEEAVRDHGLDLAAGLQVVAAERLTSTPIEPSRPLLIVPLALLGGAMAAPSAALPGRHGPNGRDPLVLLRRLYPAAATVAPLGRGGRTTTVEALTAAELEAPLFLLPSLFLRLVGGIGVTLHHLGMRGHHGADLGIVAPALPYPHR